MSYHLQKEIERLRQMLQKLSCKVEHSLNQAVKAFLENNKELAREIIEFDREIDRDEIELEEECLKILALYQPVAMDLRLVVGYLKINSDLERVGDLSVKIVKRSLTIFQSPKSLEIDFYSIMKKTEEMLRLSLNSLLYMDVNLALKVCEMDKILDEYKIKSVAKITETIKIDATNTEYYLSYLSLVRALERIGDYATNIAEDVVYMLDGEIIRHKLRK